MTLLRDCLDYCARTRTAETALGKHAVGDGMFVTNLRLGRNPRDGTVRRVRAAMADYPEGIHPVAKRRAGRPRVDRDRNRQTPAADPVDREPCFRCGVRGDIGCEHRRNG